MLTLHGQVARMLHEEHVAVIHLLQRLTALLSQYGPAEPPRASTVGPLLNDLTAAIETEIAAHFAFEERALFPVLNANGEGELSDLYIEEHRAIVPLGATVADIARAALREGFDPQRWAAFHPRAREFADRLTRHAESEEAALVPLLDDLLDGEEDDRLAADRDAAR